VLAEGGDILDVQKEFADTNSFVSILAYIGYHLDYLLQGAHLLTNRTTVTNDCPAFFQLR
jgi:hypothetical protein